MKFTQQRGVVALEAMLSMVLLVVTFYAMWSTAQVIYQQSRLNTAVQLASVGGLIEYNRTVPRGSGAALLSREKADRAKEVARQTFQENFCSYGSYIGGAAGNSATDAACSTFNSDFFEVQFFCAADVKQSQYSLCTDAAAQGRKNSRALEARVSARVSQPWVLASVYNGFFSLNSEEPLELSSQSSTYAYSAKEGE